MGLDRADTFFLVSCLFAIQSTFRPLLAVHLFDAEEHVKVQV